MFKPKKTLGQNFLTDVSAAREMVEALRIETGEEVIEIGPGQGVLTNLLLEKAGKVSTKIYAVELDKRLFQNLVSKYESEKNIEFYCNDILQWLPKFSTEKEFKIIGSIPYYITSPIIHQIIKMKKRPHAFVLLIQKEVAEKIKNKAPDASYMSSFVQTFFDVRYLGKVTSDKFYPQPQVDSGIIKFTLKSGDFSQEFIRKYEGFLHRAYSSPRKMLNKVFKKEELEKGKIDGSLRAQNLNAEEWLEFFNILNEI